ncbi:MAG: N-acetylmuramoyl-L-alanine amidase [Deltaproteobacteria bacterium]
MSAARLRPFHFAAISTLVVACADADHLHPAEAIDEPEVAFVAQDEELASRLVVEDGWQRTDAIPLDVEFDRIAFRFDAIGDVVAQARVSNDGGETYGAWRDAEITFSEERAKNAHVDVREGGTHVQLRFSTAEVLDLSFLAVEAFHFDPQPVEEVEEIGTSASGLASTGVAVSRSAWGARASRCSGGHRPNRITVHHTVTPNNDSMSQAARVRQVQSFHMNSRGWCDVGYHFLVGQDGRVYQGRPERLIGAHVGGHNTNNAGVSYIGTYTSRAPSNAMFAAGGRILKSLSREYGITLNRTYVKGHRQLGSTACPGGALYARLSDLIAIARGSNPGGGGGFCATHGGTWCDGNDLVVCRNGSQVSRDRCAHGCRSMPSGTPDRCHAPPSFCAGKTGTWCDGNDRVVCNGGATVSRTRCTHGCQTMPQGTPDRCAPAPSFCDTHAGTWCDGNDLVVCANNNERSRTRCANGCQSMPQGTPDQCAAPPAGSYSDLPAGAFGHGAAEKLRALGALWGCAPGQFCPNQPITRGELAYVIARVDRMSFSAPSSASFNDVGRGHWGFAEVEEVASRGVMQGCASGRFCPEDGVSRAAGAVFVRRALGLADRVPSSPTFSDVPLSHWASKAIERLAARNDVRGCATGRYCPADALTRAQAAVIVVRAFRL